MALPKNVLGTELKLCCTAPMTGFYRDGYCRTGLSDEGLHIVCCVMTAEFLEFSKSAGNDLSTPIPEYEFPGLQPGDQWCLCMLRWKQALEAGCAPKVALESTHMSAIEFASIEDLKAHAIDAQDRRNIGYPIWIVDWSLNAVKDLFRGFDHFPQQEWQHFRQYFQASRILANPAT